MSDIMVALELECERSYSPALLLDARLPVEITDTSWFREECESAYRAWWREEWYGGWWFQRRMDGMFYDLLSGSELHLLAADAGCILGCLSACWRRDLLGSGEVWEMLSRLRVVAADRLVALAGVGAG